MRVLSKRILNNFNVTLKTISHCSQSGIGSYRLSSEITPLLSHPDLNLDLTQLDDAKEIFDIIDETMIFEERIKLLTLIVNNINTLKHRFSGYELFTNSIAISFFNFNDRNKYMFFNALGSDLLLVKCNLRFRKFEVVSEIIIKYIIDLLFIYDNTLLVLPELNSDISNNIIENLIIGYNKIKKSYSDIILKS